MKRGEIRWYRFAHPDKKRPVLILTRNSAMEYLGEVTVAPITSTVREVSSQVILTQADGMQKECAVNLHHVQTVAKNKLGALITELPTSKMAMVKQALLFALDFI